MKKLDIEMFGENTSLDPFEGVEALPDKTNVTYINVALSIHLPPTHLENFDELTNKLTMLASKLNANEIAFYAPIKAVMKH